METTKELQRSGVKEALPGMAISKKCEREMRILSAEPVALPPQLASRTDVLPDTLDTWWERGLRRVRLVEFARRSRALRRSWVLFRKAAGFAGVITLGDLEGLAFAALQRLRGRRRAVHVMYDCLWYGGRRMKRAGMHFCLREVDRCIVWASVERARYSRAYSVPLGKFLFVPHHHTAKHYKYEVGDDGYIFTGGNVDRDFGLFTEAVRELSVPCVLATNRPRLLSGLSIPSHVRVVSVPPAEFRQLMARAKLVVMPMRATLLHAGGQQTVLNAMLMGKPVILTDPEGGEDYIQNGKTGVLVPYGDVTALQQAIRFVWEHPDEAHAMGERARLAAAPLSTERCNTVIWNVALTLWDESGFVPEHIGRPDDVKNG